MLVREVAQFLVETLRGHECVVEVVPRGWRRGVQVPQVFIRGFQGNLDVVAEDATENPSGSMDVGDRELHVQHCAAGDGQVEFP